MNTCAQTLFETTRINFVIEKPAEPGQVCFFTGVSPANMQIGLKVSIVFACSLQEFEIKQ